MEKSIYGSKGVRHITRSTKNRKNNVFDNVLQKLEEVEKLKQLFLTLDMGHYSSRFFPYENENLKDKNNPLLT